ncbi:MAG: threonine synthase [Hyphomicrobiales bacterium]|nr:threonine synthase [Hyphomicrobiales bacterium]PCJ88805.1 MAG: threonine synthase [Hyphomicrobiales bacterium]
MQYVSTRGDAPKLGFLDTILAGLARDGGLYMPETWPQLSLEQIRDLRGKPYEDVAFAIMSPFINGEIPDDVLKQIIHDAYASFRHRAVAPLVQIGPNQHVLELFHGPTMAFKDVAMQWLARVMDYALAQSGRKATIIGATSGDTGGAAIEAFRGRENTDIFIMFPDGLVSDVQRKQMTTVADDNVHTIAIDGNFDDCQALVKAMFNDHAFRDRLSITGVNSINWGRILAQVVYYFTSSLALGGPDRPVSFCVPTGNFGDILAGFVAKKMGLPIDRLLIATNINDILVRTVETGRYEATGVTPTTAPSMDIQVSSNFERLLFEAHGKDGAAITRLMAGLQQSGAFTLPDDVLASIKTDFDAARTTEQDTAETIRALLDECGYLLDPHTAIGVHAAQRHVQTNAPMVILGTAHPAKFPDAVEAACGTRPLLPAWQGDLMSRPERQQSLANDLETVERFVSEKARAAN